MRALLVWVGVAVPVITTRDAHALDSHRGITQYAQTRYEAHDGLAHNLVNSLAQTPDGYLWAGSEEGLTRYDGETFTSFDHRNDPTGFRPTRSARSRSTPAACCGPARAITGSCV